MLKEAIYGLKEMYGEENIITSADPRRRYQRPSVQICAVDQAGEVRTKNEIQDSLCLVVTVAQWSLNTQT